MARQKWTAQNYLKHAAYITSFGQEVLELLAVQHGESILDLGCGDGTLAQEIQSRGAIVTGIDTATDMLALTEEKGVKTLRISAENMEFEGEFNAVFSNAALNWMQDYRGVIRGVKKALKPGAVLLARWALTRTAASSDLHGATIRGRRRIRPLQKPMDFPAAGHLCPRSERGGLLNHLSH